ncbi:hypothetical protein CUB78_06750 [Prochlorococcus marinus str. XMU1401]|uniref:MBL fold metallo-hydrolase n=1 Tax=Prochlorococcus marinus str. XMU1401 TaxID=2052594 RepID=A0A8I1X133_PROMR|nr:MBL fold metallo-hydrolase [Prochlorococcus marinus]MBO8223300.1 MBL fold metallo-hydrolase [Prochlorococcus marinus str. XMU1401]MBW3059833.1 hypothetical protein [Prochlorococcus marinus str. XMU1401E]MCQ9198942.1 MBL fold metallo-hydrolase [Prochlorococcus marinus XMU1429]PJC83646.1 hypothetical protein CUB78_06750 [Prochlorococcus marinus str. XMU1401]
MFKVFYKYSACISICTDDTTILCDPWFSDAYEGTWTQYPKQESYLKNIGDFDVVYISHIHPDHYDSTTLKKLFKFYGNKKIIIADWGDSKGSFLEKKMQSDGFGKFLTVSNNLDFGKTRVNIIPNSTGSISDIDSAILVSSIESNKSVLNINDCIYNESLFNKINNLKEKLNVEISLFCLGYTGAGPYPQTYYSPFTEKEVLEKKAEEKKISFFKRYSKTIKAISSKKRLPFAGKYLLQGNLSVLNKYRGVADAMEVKDFDKDAIVLDDGGDCFFNIETLSVSRERSEKYDLPDIFNFEKIFSWRKNISFFPSNVLLKRLLIQSIKRAHQKSECEVNALYSFYVYDKPEEFLEILQIPKPYDHFESLFTFNCNKNLNPFDLPESVKVHSHVFIESKALFAVLTGLTHWNNYEVGSVYQVRRLPDIYIREMYSYLNFLSVI